MRRLFERPGLTTPQLPHVSQTRNHETAFFHVPTSASPKKLFCELFNAAEPPRATSGGVIENGCTLTLPDAKVLHGVTWHGETLADWRADFHESASVQNILTAQFRGWWLYLSDGQRIHFRDLVIESDLETRQNG